MMSKSAFTSSSPFPVALLISIFILSCGGGSDSKSHENDSALFTEAEKEILSDITKIIADLPPPSVVPNTIQQIGTTYNPDLINSMDKLSAYLIEDSKAALNLGIYGTDIGYLIEYDQVQESLERMNACKQLAERLGVSTAFDLTLMQKYEAAMGNHDELVKLLNETILLAEKRLESSDRINMAAMVLTGSFIEGMYLAVRVLEDTPLDQQTQEEKDRVLEPLVQLVLGQKQPLLDILSMLDKLPSNEDIATLTVELNILRRLFESDLAEVEISMANDPDFVLNQEMLLDINLEVIRIRNKIVQ
ncbi:MAG: hypothetical protein OEY56_04265 [Cyclobacteriaceae bacterium]|nr:hypothetical protein [Cyclobacteriaceae bacterium]